MAVASGQQVWCICKHEKVQKYVNRTTNLTEPKGDTVTKGWGADVCLARGISMDMLGMRVKATRMELIS